MQVPADYIKEASIARLAEQGQKLHAAVSRPRSTRSNPASACPRPSCSRSGAARPTTAATRCPMTRSACWRRRPMSAGARTSIATNSSWRLKMLGDGVVTRKDMRSSWAGATGLTQFLPSEFYKHGVDLDGDGKVDIWHSVPDALASAAQQLVNKGWQSGLRWAYEVKAPASVDCTMGVPEVTQADRRLAARGLCAGARTRSSTRRSRRSRRRCCSPKASMARPFSPRRTTSSSRNTISPISTCCSSAISATA